MKLKEIFKLTGIPVLTASLCCLSPLVTFLLGLSTASAAASLADVLYGEYKWLFRILGLLFLLISITLYFRKQKNICTLDELKRRKNEVINTVFLTLTFAVLAYMVFLYVIVHYVGVYFQLWQ